MKASRSRGFTLIELVVVITILGILSAFAIPRFISLDTSARIATLNALSGTVTGAAALARSASMANANTTSVTMENQTVTLANSYPDASPTGIGNAINASSNFALTAGGTANTTTGTAVWKLQTGCTVTYTPAQTAGATPSIQIASGGC